MRTLITSVPRPTTTSTVYPPPNETEEDDDDNPAIIDLNETTTASTTNNSTPPISTITRIQSSSNYIPSFYQTTRPSRRHLFSRIRGGTRINGTDGSETEPRTNTLFTQDSTGLDETIASIETLEITNDNEFCAVIGRIQDLPSTEEIILGESGYPTSASITLCNIEQPEVCPTHQENNNCLMARDTRPKQSGSSQMRSRTALISQGSQSQQNRVSRERREVQIENP